ncbi:hypothetical protein [Dysgonomonas reticulitermitis]
MKQIIFVYLFLFLSLPVFSQGIVHIEIQDFKEENDSLSVSYRARVSPGAIETSQSLRFYPVVQAGDQARILPGVTILGKNREKVLSRFDKGGTGDFIPAGSIKEEALLNYNVKTPYAQWMDSACLVLHQEITGYRNKSTLTTYRFDNNAGLAGRVHPAVAFMIPQREEIKHRGRQVKAYWDFQDGEAYFTFQQGRAALLPDFRRNAEALAAIDEVIRDVANNPDAALQSIYIISYASPEGSYTTNDRLAKERAQALVEYIRGRFNLNGGLFRVSSVAEDWEGLAEHVRAGDMPQKDRILEIISSVGIHDGREAQLMLLDKGDSYRSMLKEVFPRLRRVECLVDYIVREYDLRQSAIMLDKRPGDLSQLELYNLALSYGAGSTEYNRILLEVIPKNFPEDATANSNAAAVLIRNGEPAAAMPYLEKAGDSGSAQNNKGVIALLSEDMEKAEACFTKAYSLGCEEAAANLKKLQAKRKYHQNRK